MYEKKIFMILQFYDPFLWSEFILHFPCRVKNAFLTTLTVTPSYILGYPRELHAEKLGYLHTMVLPQQAAN